MESEKKSSVSRRDFLRQATKITARAALGESGMGVVTRVMGMVLAAIAMGMLAEGLKGMLPGLAG